MGHTHGTPVAWTPLLGATMPRWVFLAATLPIALWLTQRPGLHSISWRAVALHLALFGVISLGHAVIATATMGVASPIALIFPWPSRLVRSLFNGMPVVLSLYGAVLAVGWALSESRDRQERAVRASQLEAQLQSARLEALRAKLQPHFLHNTLNGIAALVADGSTDRAVQAIEQLSDLLHASLRDDGRDLVTVAEETGLAERYLALQRMQFGDRLQFDIRVDPNAAQASVPVLLLQPLVENAVVHGMDSGQAGLRITIAVTHTSLGTCLRVENDGPALDPAATRGNGRGVGLAATRARLAAAYGDRASLEILPRPSGGVVVQIIVPPAGAA